MMDQAAGGIPSAAPSNEDSGQGLDIVLTEG
jgi:hypothetical protein